MNPNIIALEKIHIAKPCRADWDNMTGDERTRFCGGCHKNVYDISQMTRAQAQQLIAAKEGNVCLRLHRRPDGTVITSDCPVGIAATPRPLWFAVAALVALVGAGLAGCTSNSAIMGDVAPIAAPNIETQVVAPIKIEAPTMELGKIAAARIDKGLVSNGRDSGVTLGAPLMGKPAPQSASTPQPTNVPLMGEPTIAPAAAAALMGDMAPICEKPEGANNS